MAPERGVQGVLSAFLQNSESISCGQSALEQELHVAGVFRPGFRPARQICAASLQFEPGAWAWVEAQPDNDQSGLWSAVIQ